MKKGNFFNTFPVRELHFIMKAKKGYIYNWKANTINKTNKLGKDYTV